MLNRKLSLFIVIVIVIILLFTIYIQVTNDPRVILDVQKSPNKQVIAYSYFDSGGGGAGYCSYGIDIIELGGDIGLFSFHAGHENIFEVISCNEKFHFKWAENVSESNIDIFCPNNLYQKTKLKKIDSINISYHNC